MGAVTEIAGLPALWDGPDMADRLLILAHGAGAPMDSPFMDHFAAGLAAVGNRVLRFEFPYMAARRHTGTKRPPDRQEKLLASWRQVFEAVDFKGEIYIGGKSMGGRMASLVADRLAPAGLVCLGYPFHAPGKADRPRTAHLEMLETPTLIVQGERDTMGKRETVSGYALSPAIALYWATDGNHDLVPRKATGLSARDAWDRALQAMQEFLEQGGAGGE